MIEKYDVILADPPWTFQTYSAKGKGRSAERHYDCMTFDDIVRLPVSQIATDNCALFLWTTWPFMEKVFEVIHAWGFTYRTLGFEWFKENRSGNGWHMGMGYYTRSNPEPCLLCVRGSMPVAVHDEPNFIVAPVRAHSRKPAQQYYKIENLYPNKRYVELFARERRQGWASWGYGVASDPVFGGIDD